MARITEPVAALVRGRRRDFALGRRLKSGQDFSVGVPLSSKIWWALGVNINKVGGGGNEEEGKFEGEGLLW